MNAATLQARFDSAKYQYTIPEGTHTLEAPLRLASGKTLRCADRGVRLVVAAGATHSAILAQNCSDIEIDLGGAVIEHQVSTFTEVATDKHCLTIRNCSGVNVRGGQLRGGVHSVYCISATDANFYDVATHHAVGWGAIFADCLRLKLDNYSAVGHCGDGLRLLANNRHVEINGGLFAHNGGYLTPNGPGSSGVGLHIGQSAHVIIRRGTRIIQNANGGFDWKSTEPPDGIWANGIPWGTCEDCTLEDVVAIDNYNNSFSVVWNDPAFVPGILPGTIIPTGFTMRRCRSYGSPNNAVYLDCADASIDRMHFAVRPLNFVATGLADSRVGVGFVRRSPADSYTLTNAVFATYALANQQVNYDLF